MELEFGDPGGSLQSPGKSEPWRKERAEDLEGLVDDDEDLDKLGVDLKSRRAESAPSPASAQAGLEHSLYEDSSRHRHWLTLPAHF